MAAGQPKRAIPCGMLWKIAQIGQSALGEPGAQRASLRLYKTLFQPIFLAISGFAESSLFCCPAQYG